MKQASFWVILIAVMVSVTGVMLELGARAFYYHKKGPHTFAVRHIETTVRGLATGMVGNQLPRRAWDASFTELGQVPPESGPRDGFWGKKTSPKNMDCGSMIICERDQLIDGLVDIRDNGLQYSGDPNSIGPNILIIGGSVAWGSYSSSIATSYFSVLGDLMREQFPAASVTVLARGAARSDDDLAAFVLRGVDLKPDIVVFLNGLNDIYIPSMEGGDMDARKFVRNMDMARRVAEENGVEFYVALQPFPHGKHKKSRYEEAMLSRVEVAGFPGPDAVESAREIIRSKFKDISDSTEANFVDCSTVFDQESVSIFTDQWHFADKGHQLLAECLSESLIGTMSQSVKWSPDK